jgi:hypothetical protein
MRRPSLAAFPVAIVLLLVACQRTRPISIRDRARSLLAAFRPVAVKVDVKTVLKSAAHAGTDRAIDHAADRADRATRERPRPRPRPQPQPDDQPGPDPQRTNPPPVQIDRVDASKPTVFVMRWQTRGGKASCEVHTNKDDCTRACTALLQAHAMKKPDNSTPQGCVCNEQDGGC